MQTVTLSFVVTVDVQCQGKMESALLQDDGRGHAAKRTNDIVG